MCKAPCWVLGEVLGVIRLTLVLGEELMISWGGGELMDKTGCGECRSEGTSNGNHHRCHAMRILGAPAGPIYSETFIIFYSLDYGKKHMT